MWVYLLLLGVVLVVLIISIVYIVKLTHKSIVKVIKNKTLGWILSFLPLVFFGIGLYIDMVNAIVVDMHLIVIIAIIMFIAFIIKKLAKKEISEYIILTIGIVITTIVMVRGYYLAHHIVETNYTIYTEKELGMDNFRIIQISDSHIGTTMNGKEFSKYMENINKLNPDIVVITGDFIDDNTTYSDMKEASNGLGNLKTRYGVYFVYGNHDKGYYQRSYSYKDLEEELAKNNVRVLQDEIVELNNNVIIVGRCDKENKNRIDVSILTQEIDKNKYLIVLNHQPNDYDNEEKSGVDLVLSGHTHGGQLIPLGQFGLFLKANDSVYGLQTRNNTTFIVNSGISDWAIKFKTGTKSEYGVIDIKKNKE